MEVPSSRYVLMHLSVNKVNCSYMRVAVVMIEASLTIEQTFSKPEASCAAISRCRQVI